ncbi:trypsin-like peptidase domain-containing protein [Cellulomonas sp.]|uniref:S1C family serine protease n=1 Tax=Cellulomonas sp. TaxID=40001 RepID=UPI001B2158E2|nr:trypsin-like peptidase domain-containing protein [Cellulomonas sp.]MBO9554610.1 trypsin-like peptidase domain-containing protein [Cellulomonas sp.]
MTSTPEHGPQHPQANPTQPIPPVEATQPLPTAPVGATQPLPATPAPQQAPQQPAQPVAQAQHPTNPFQPPHPAAPADQRAAYEAAQDAQRRAAYAQWAAGQHQAQGQPQHPRQPGQPGHTGAAFGPYAAPTATQPRKRSVWLPVTGAAAAAAILAAGLTAGVTHALADGDTASGSHPASLATIGQSSNDAVPVSGSTNDNPDWEAVSKAVAPAVVAIEVTTDQGGAQGSGVIIDDHGHVVTNNHVVAGAQGDVQVTLTDGRLFKATVVGTDPTTDLAVIKLTDPPSDLKPAALGDSAKVVVGQPVMAVGNPLGLANTVTTGIVSAVDRPVSTTGENGGEATVTNAIQIDAAVNPGNSGGPLFDAQGRVIGINSSIATLSQQSGSIGLGFAIPVDLVKNIASQLVDDGSAEHAFLGVSLTDGTATADGVTRRGAVVQEVTDGSPAAKAGVQADDVIVAIDGKPVGGAESLTAYVRALASGAEAKLTIVRDGKASDVDVTLAVKKETAQQAPQGQGQQGQQGQDGGPSGLPGGLDPEQLWKWYQEQGQG